MGARPSEHPLLLTEPSWNSKEAREEMIELAFEGLDVPALILGRKTYLFDRGCRFFSDVSYTCG
jgi:actin-related protein